jgi:2-oxo-4-hydroxy-4-carboxy-5-ureidoimidazoline decarboxylase
VDAVLTVVDVNALDEDAFVAAFGHVYEDTPVLAASAWRRRPFADRDALEAAFVAATDDLDDDGIVALLRAHPQLAASAPMTASSTDEQRAAGLATLDDGARDEIGAGNARYFERFGFPFIIAVRGLTPAAVAGALTQRLGNHEDEERKTALEQVQRIAVLRIEQLVAV